MNRKVGFVVCIFAGHRWTVGSGDEAHAGLVILHCDRCAAESLVSAETFEAENYIDRYMRKEISENPYVRPEDLDPMLRERRRPPSTFD